MAIKIINPGYKILSPTKEQSVQILKHIESTARTCYQSQDRTDDKSYLKLIELLRNRGHTAMLEFGVMAVRFVVDRGVTHEIVRHRIASFAQKSTRYCTELGGIGVIEPPGLDHEARLEWISAMEHVSNVYSWMINEGFTPQIARSVLPTCLASAIVVQANFTEWRHIFKLRTSKAAHPQMRQVMVPLLTEAKNLIPIVFDDIEPHASEEELYRWIKEQMEFKLRTEDKC